MKKLHTEWIVSYLSTMRLLYVSALFLISFFLVNTISLHAQPAAVDSVLRELQKIKDDSLRLDAIFSYNRQLWETDPSQTPKVIQAALDDAERINNRFFIAKSFSALGYTYLLAADYPRALKYFLDALAIWRERNDKVREAETLLFIADIHTKNDQLQEARQFAEQSIDIIAQNHIDPLEAKAHNQAAIIYEKLGQPLKAITFYQQGITAAVREKDKYFEAFLLGNMATSYKSLDKPALALQTYQQVLAIGDSLQDQYIAAVATFNIAETYFELDKLDESKVYASRALSGATAINESETMAGAYSLLKRIALAHGDYKSAMDYFTREVAIRDTVFNHEKAAQLAQLQTRFDTKLKDAQITEQHTQIALGRKVNMLLGALVILVTLAGALIWMQQRRTSRLHQQVAAQKVELQQLNEVKDRIFTVISHDMRTPVNSIIAFMQLLEQDNMTQEKLAAYSAELKTSMVDTTTLLENLLNWAKSQMQGYKPLIETIDAKQQVAGVIELMKRDVLSKGITVLQKIAPGTLIKADINMTAIVLRNLLHNAVKFSPRGETIRITADSLADKVQLIIKDKGKGFDAQAIAAINGNSYQQASSTAGTANEQGTGLGLLLCKTFLKQMDCSLHLQSEPGKGSTFTITFPVGR